MGAILRSFPSLSAGVTYQFFSKLQQKSVSKYYEFQTYLKGYTISFTMRDHIHKQEGRMAYGTADEASSVLVMFKKMFLF